MPRRRTIVPWMLPARRAGTPVGRWLYEWLRDGLLAGRLRPGERLPATRDFAHTQGVARGTVVTTFAQLASEGYLVSAVGSGTYVASDLPESILEARRLSPSTSHAAGDTPRRNLSGFAHRLSAFPPGLTGRVRAFRANVPALERFPTALWGRIAGRRLALASRTQLDACEPAGYRPLRVAVAHYLDRFRGVRCEPDQVLIVGGVQSAVYLVARL